MFFNPLKEIKSFTQKLENHAKAQDLVAATKTKKVLEIEQAIREVTEEANQARNFANVLKSAGAGNIVTVATPDNEE